MNYYICNLLQVTENQEYIDSNKPSKSEMENLIYYGIDNSNCVLNKIIVKRTINPYFVKEIIMRKTIPILHSNIKIEEYYDKFNYKLIKYPYGKIHTFVNLLKIYDILEPKQQLGLEKVTYSDIGNYIFEHKNIEIRQRTIDSYFLSGRKKCNNQNKVKIKK